MEIVAAGDQPNNFNRVNGDIVDDKQIDGLLL